MPASPYFRLTIIRLEFIDQASRYGPVEELWKEFLLKWRYYEHAERTLVGTDTRNPYKKILLLIWRREAGNPSLAEAVTLSELCKDIGKGHLSRYLVEGPDVCNIVMRGSSASIPPGPPFFGDVHMMTVPVHSLNNIRAFDPERLLNSEDIPQSHEYVILGNYPGYRQHGPDLEETFLGWAECDEGIDSSRYRAFAALLIWSNEDHTKTNLKQPEVPTHWFTKSDSKPRSNCRRSY